MKKLIICSIVLLFSVTSLWSSKKKSIDQETKGKDVGLILDGFEANDWMPTSAEGTTIRTTLVSGIDGQAVEIDYDLKKTQQWVQINKDITLSTVEGKAIVFHYKVSGKRNNVLEVKLEDGDGSIYGKKIPIRPSKSWVKVLVNIGDLTYWWGGNPKLEGIQRIWFAISGGEGGKGSLILDDLRLVESERRATGKITSGLFDDCDSLEGWETDHEQGSKVKLISVAGKKRKALGIVYDLSEGSWVQVYKNFRVELKEDSVFQFYLKWTGKLNNLEFKLTDADGSVFGKKLELENERQWQLVKVPVSRLTYWWGGDEELDMKHVKKLWFAVSRLQGGGGSMGIDQLALVE